MKYAIATRKSKLALCQAEFVRGQLGETFPEHTWELKTFTTTGDRILDRPLSDFGGKGVFLKEIEEALLRGDAQLAVHSLKDVPALETPGLQLSAFLPREDPRDVWVSHQDDLMHLPAGKKVGTSSLRRSMLVQFYRKDLQVELLRGNIDTRLRKLEEGQHDAIVVAAAGLHRLNLFDSSYMHYLFEDGFIPAVGQGILVIQTAISSEVSNMMTQLNDPDTATAARIERTLLRYVEGGCQLPLGALANKRDGKWFFRAFLGGVKSRRLIQESVEETDPDSCAAFLFEKLIQLGARELLAEMK